MCGNASCLPLTIAPPLAPVLRPPSPVPASPSLLVSIHDISPLTLGECRRAADLVLAAGIPTSALTLLAIPDHEGKARLDANAETRIWLASLADAGATLVMHGFTHRMPRSIKNPLRWPQAYLFARGQGEFLACDAEEANVRIAGGMDILRKSGLEAALWGFVPPAWLLSPAARKVVQAAGFRFVEYFSGIDIGSATLARRVMGLGSLSAIEAVATAGYATLAARWTAADTRLAIHPADMRRPFSARAMARLLARLREKLRPQNYADFVFAHAAAVDKTKGASAF